MCAAKKHIKRENGQGSIYKRADIKRRPWVAYTPARYDTDAHGKVITIREKIGSYATEREAKAALEEYRQHPTTKINITVAGVYAEWSPSAYSRISVQMIRCYKAAWAKMDKIYDLPMRDVRTGQLQAIIDYYASPHPDQDKDGNPLLDETGAPVMASPLSGSSLSKIKLLMGQLYGYALSNDIVTKDYSDYVVMPKQQKTEKECFTDVEIAKIAAAVGTVPHADTILLMCYTGWRIGELLTLTPLSYHPDDHTLHGGSKTDAGKNRCVPVHPKVQPILDDKLAQHGQTIICKEDGRPMSQQYFRESCYYPALEKIGVRRLTPHATRHTFLTRMAAAGVRPEDITAIAGHESYTITANTYIHQSTETLRKAVEQMA